MPTTTEVRDWARAEGHQPPAKGRIPRDLADAYNLDHPDDPYQAGGPVNGAAPDYPDDDFESAFADPPPGGRADPGDTGESRPRQPPRTGARAKGKPGGGWKLFGGKGKSGGKKAPRVSTEDLCGAAWRGLAGMARPLPPLYRTLRVQAPVAGVLLEDAVQGTVIDPLLQPLARLAGAGKAIHALVGPPVYVTAISVHAGQMEALGRPANPFFMSIAKEGLRSSLMAWMDVAGPKFKEAMKREKQFEEEYGESVDDMIAWLFSMPADNDTEEQNIRAHQGLDEPAVVVT
jgi:hypothetical protein